MKDTTWIGVALGGFAGALARFGLSQYTVARGLFPMNILMINLLGAFLLALFLEISLERLRLSAFLRTGISTGFLGSFTTFSGLCAEAFAIADGGAVGMAGLYMAISIAGGILAAFAGIAAARKIMKPPGALHE